jgi:hypothetical protein
MLWHRAAIYHLPQLYASSSTVPTELSLLFYDHTVSNDTKQDMWSVASLIEAIMMRIRRDLSHVKEIVLASDNATCYQNQVLPSLLSFLAATVGLHIFSLLPREVQDGKSIVDAHFALAMLHVNRFVKAGHDATCWNTIPACQPDRGRSAVKYIQHHHAGAAGRSMDGKKSIFFIQRMFNTSVKSSVTLFNTKTLCFSTT